MKCKPAKATACDQYFDTNLRKSMQARIDKGIITGYVLGRLVDPVAIEAGYSHSYTITSTEPSLWNLRRNTAGPAPRRLA